MKIWIFTIIVTCGFKLSAQNLPDKYIDFFSEMLTLSFEEKFEMLDEAIADNPKDPWYYWMKAGVYELMGNDAKTIENHEKSLSLDSNFSAGHASLARFLFYTDSTKLDSALEHINIAIGLEPEDDYYHIDRGRIYLELKKYDLAMVEADYALAQTDFDFTAAAQLKVETLYAQKRKEELREFLRQNDLSGEGEFLNYEFCLLLASVYEEMGENDKACKLFRGAAEPYLIMEEEIPNEISKKLKECE